MEVTLLKADLQGMEKLMHDLVADLQAPMEPVPEAGETPELQRGKGRGLQMAEELGAPTCLMPALREEPDILRA